MKNLENGAVSGSLGILKIEIFCVSMWVFKGMSGYDPSVNYKNINVWWKKVREHFNPVYDEGHVIVNKIIKKNTQVASKI
ncbi:hypothetical protein HF086_002577 [Spodoptera exigua]|uniref:Uncharacterized protein n=1 Tax=Spodoptera exigua TaxID=7107 RepID=A0A922SNH8_SPOEX|nr:hypothetical protein HF086_002577 [Spodoptera exigua]